ncbi:MAG: cyclase family protein [Rubripirellula sp.]
MNERRIIDLSLSVDSHLPNAQVDPYKSIDVEGWNATMLHLYSHCGTHMDAPFHFLPDGETMEALNLQACCGPARVVNLAPVEAAELITVDRFQAALRSSLEPGERLLLRTDWHERYPSAEYRDRLPRISIELAQWFVEQQVRLVGVEPPSVADVNNSAELTDVHQTLFRGGVVIVEGLCNLDQIPGEQCDFVALPLRILGGDGCPVRAIAMVGDEEPNPSESFGFSRR